MEQYTEKAMDHFANPRNVGSIENADGVGQVGNLKCGDVMEISIRVGTRKIKKSSTFAKASTFAEATADKTADLRPADDSQPREEYIEDIKFKTLGCAAAIASSSMTTELARGMSLEDAMKISKDDVNEALGKLPAPKYHCSILAVGAIKKAIEDYQNKKK